MRNAMTLRMSWLIGILGLCTFNHAHGKVVGSERNDVNQNGTVAVLNIEDINKTQYLNQNFRSGSYNYGYDIKPEGPNGQFHHENKAEDGVVYGCYGYVDPTDKPQITYYVSDSWGYRPLPVGHPTKLFFPADHPQGATEMKGVERQWLELEFPKQCANYEQEALSQVETNNPNPLTRVSPPLNFVPSALTQGPAGPPITLVNPFKPTVTTTVLSTGPSNIRGEPGKPGGPGGITSGGYGGEGGSGGQVTGSATAHGGRGGDGGHGGSASGSATANGAGGGAGGKGGNASGSSTANGGNGGNGGDGGDASGSSVANGGLGSSGGNGGSASGSSTANGGAGATGGKGGSASGSSTANGGNGSAAGNGGSASGSSVANGGDAGYAGAGGRATGSSTANGGNSGQGGHGGNASGSSTANGGHAGKAGNGGNASGSSTSNGGNAGNGGNGGSASGSSKANAGTGGDAGNGGNASGSSAANGGDGGTGGNGSGGSYNAGGYPSGQGQYSQGQGGNSNFESNQGDIQRHTSTLQKPNRPLYPETSGLLSEDRYTPENIDQGFPNQHLGGPTGGSTGGVTGGSTGGVTGGSTDGATKGSTTGVTGGSTGGPSQGPPGINISTESQRPSSAERQREPQRPSSAERQRPQSGSGSGGYQYQRPTSGGYEYPRPDAKPTPSVGHQRPPAETRRPQPVSTQPPYSAEAYRPNTASTQQNYPAEPHRPQGGAGQQRYPSSQSLPSQGTSPAPKPFKPRQPEPTANGYYPGKRPGSHESNGVDQPSFGDRFPTNGPYPSKEPSYQQGSIEVPSGGYVPPPDSSESAEREQNNLGNDFGDQPSQQPTQCSQGGCGSCSGHAQQPQEIDYSQIPGAVVSNVPVIFYPDCRTNAYTRPAIVPFCPSLQPSPPPAACSHHQPLTMKFPAGNNPYASLNVPSSRGAYPSNFVNTFPQHNRQARRVVRRSRNQHRFQA